jgi:uncharacterized phage protein (TIGR01671 family)
MREIKFRAWDKERKVMVDAGCPDLIMTTTGQIYIEDRYGNTINVTDRFELLQFTGLKDTNGKEIYDGDIIIVKDLHDSNAFDMVWNTEKQIPIPQIVKFSDTPYGVIMPSDSGQHPQWWEIIGNVYENKDLLGAMK